jgi:hypothetical protein
MVHKAERVKLPQLLKVLTKAFRCSRNHNHLTAPQLELADSLLLEVTANMHLLMYNSAVSLSHNTNNQLGSLSTCQEAAYGGGTINQAATCFN